jgi:hypothetical protein
MSDIKARIEDYEPNWAPQLREFHRALHKLPVRRG